MDSYLRPMIHLWLCIGYQNNVLYFEAKGAANGRELRALSPLQIKAEIIPKTLYGW